MAALYVAAALVFYLRNSTTDPVTRRRRFNFLPDPLVACLRAGKTDTMIRRLGENPGFLPHGDRRSQVVAHVMNQLILAGGFNDEE